MVTMDKELKRIKLTRVMTAILVTFLILASAIIPASSYLVGPVYAQVNPNGDDVY
jgi:hypothetical protein